MPCYTYGIGQAGGHSNTKSGAGGASTILRVWPGSGTGVLLNAGGGGGGEAATTSNGSSGGGGGIALSTTTGSCPPDCLEGSSSNSNCNGGAGFTGSGDLAPSDGGGCGMTGSGETICLGNNGFGGAGGSSEGWGTATWIQGDPFVPTGTGQGASEGNGCNGAGGGGNGGGVAGDGGGGGGGGSFAFQSSLMPDENGAPTDWCGTGFLYFIFNSLSF